MTDALLLSPPNQLAPLPRRRPLKLLYEWTGPFGPRPVPHRAVRPHRPLPPPLLPPPGPRFAGLPVDPAFAAGLNGHAFLRPETPGFDFTGHMARLFADIARRLEEFAHIDPARMLVTATQARRAQCHGLQAKVTPLRFKDGELIEKRRGRHFQVQRYRVADVELLYLVTFVLPRFLTQPFEQKLTTVVHELWHIAPAFDGDFRRHHGRCHIHTKSKKGYDAKMRTLAEEYLRRADSGQPFDFLRRGFDELHQQHGGVRAARVPMPKLVPLG